MAILFFFCTLSFLPAQAKEAALWKSSGSLQGSYKAYSLGATDESASAAGGLNGEWDLTWKSSKNWKFKSDLEFQTDGISKDPSEKFRGNFRSFYLENKIPNLMTGLTIRAGYQTIIPEGPDFLNPADIIHSKDWKDPANPRWLGSAGISFSHEGDEWQWELFYIPKATLPRLPGERSPWWPRGKRIPIESDDTEFRIPEDIRYQVVGGEELNNSLSNNYVLRISRKSESFEGQAVFYEGLSQDPNVLVDSSGSLVALTPKLILLMSSPVKLKPLYFRHRAYAGTFVIPLDSWSIRGGAQQANPLGEDPRIPGAVTTGVLGIEKSFETSKGLTTFVLQHEVQKRRVNNQISFLKSIFENAWALGLHVPWGENLQFLAGYIYDTVGKSSVSRVGLTYRLTDSLSTELEIQSLQGPESTLLGLYDSYDNGSVGLTYHF